MAESPTSYSRYAGIARFPRSYADLTTTSRCPACFHVLTGVICANCQLDVKHPVAAELASLSMDVAGLLDVRTELIGRIRFETAAAARATEARLASRVSVPGSPAVVDVPVVFSGPAPGPVPTPLPTPLSAPLPAPSPAPSAPPAPPAGAATTARSPHDAPRRSSVQVALIVIGVSLVSVAAIFFLVYAFINYGIVWRSVIIGAITVAAFVVASMLRRRALTSTAEGIAAFAVVLVYLDAFAIRANNLFGAASSDALGYWGATLVVSALGFAVWHRGSALRTASIAAAIAFAPGIGLLVAGLGGPLENGTRVFVSLIAVALAGLVHPFVGARGESRPTVATAERVIAVIVGGLGLLSAFFAAFLVTPDNDAGASVALLAVGAAAVAHVAVIARTTDEKSEEDPALAHTVAAFFAAAAALSTGVAAVMFAYRALSFGPAMAASVLVSGGVALTVAYYALRSAPTATGIALRVAAVAATAVSASALVVPLGSVLLFAVDAAGTALARGTWGRSPGDEIATRTADAALAFVAVAAALVLCALFRRLTNRFGPARTAVVWVGGALLILAAPLLGTLAATAAGWLVLGAAAVALLVWSARSGSLTVHRPVMLAAAAASLVLGYSVSWASSDSWLPASVTAILLLLAARLGVAAPVAIGRAALLCAAALVALVGAAAAGRQFGGAGLAQPDDSVQFDGTVPSLWVNALAVALFALSVVPLRRILSRLDRRALFALGGAVTVATAPFSGGSVVLSAVFVAAILGWMVSKASPSNAAERVVSTVALAPALVWLLLSVASVADLPDEVSRLGGIAAALLAAAVSLALAVRLPGYSLRQAGDLGVAVVALASAFAFVLGSSDLIWLGLLVAAVTALVSAVSPAGLFAATGPRKHLGWAALALATVALWWRLSETSVTAVEPYVLPLAAALVAIAALDWRARRGDATPVLVFAAMVVAIVPIALSAATDGAARGIIVAAIAAAMLLVGSVVRSPQWARPYLDGLTVAGFASLLIVAVGQCVHFSLTTGGGADARSDLWLATALVVLAISALGQCSDRPGDRPVTPLVGQALAISGLAVVGLVESVLLDDSPLGFSRAVAATVLLAAVHVVGQAVHSAPFARSTGWVSLALGGIVAVVAVAVDAVEAVEWVSVPIGAALLVSGALRLRAEPALRSWPALGAGLLVLLVPSLVESQNDGPVWRLVAIGVVAVAVLAFGVVRRLQAPFIVGGVVALVHGFATFAPQLRDVYQATEWWVWAGVGGIVIIVLGARYERSLATAKNVIANIGGLR